MRAAMLVALLLLPALAGCLEGPRTPSEIEAEEGLIAPPWEVGDWWLYTFVTPEFGEDSARLVVADEDPVDGQWMLGISSEREAMRHAVVNHNPFLGRVTMDALSVYENGEAQRVFSFPFERDDTWSFTLFAQDWTATTTLVDRGVATVVATSDDGHDLRYTMDGGVGFLRDLTWTDPAGVDRLRMVLAGSGDSHEGQVHFLRATDLFADVYTDSDAEFRDSFLDEGHPSGVGFDRLVWYLDVDIAGGGSGSLVLRDHTSASPLSRAWGAGSAERGAVGSIPSVSGEYQLTATVQGGGSHVEVRLAGAISQSWTLG